MALQKHLSGIKNARAFIEGVEYMKYKHNEIKDKQGNIVKYEPIYDGNGNLQERENYVMKYLKADGSIGKIDDFNQDCMALHLQYGKCLNENDIKAHHYLVSFPEDENKTIQECMEFVLEYIKIVMPGHNALVTIHGDTDNLHAHIILQNLRGADIDRMHFMQTTADGKEVKPSQYLAGNCHTNHKDYRDFLMRELDILCNRRGFIVDGFGNSKTKTEAQIKAEYLHDSVIEVAKKSKTFEELQWKLEDFYNIRLEKRGNTTFNLHYPKDAKAKRIQSVGLTPLDLTSDQYDCYYENKNTFAGVKEKWDDPSTRFAKWEPDKKKRKISMPTEAHARDEYMHDSIIEVAQRCNSFTELQQILKREYNFTLEQKNTSFNVYHPDLKKAKRIQSIGLTPMDLTPDVYEYYENYKDRYENIHEKWADPRTRFASWKTYHELYDEDLDKEIKYTEDVIFRPNWKKQRTGWPYHALIWADDGHKRSLAEMLIILAMTVISGEVPELVQPARDTFERAKGPEIDRVVIIYRPKEQKLHDMEMARKFIVQMDIETPQQVEEMLKNKDLSSEERAKLEFVKQQLLLAQDKEFCYGRVFKRVQKQKKYSEEDKELAKQLLEKQNPIVAGEPGGGISPHRVPDKETTKEPSKLHKYFDSNER